MKLDLTNSERDVLKACVAHLVESYEASIYTRGHGADNCGLQATVDCAKSLCAKLNADVAGTLNLNPDPDLDHVEIGTTLVRATNEREGARHYLVTGETRTSWIARELARRVVTERDGEYSSRVVSRSYGPDLVFDEVRIAKDTLQPRTCSHRWIEVGLTLRTLARVALIEEARTLKATVEKALKGQVSIETLRAVAALLVDGGSTSAPTPTRVCGGVLEYRSLRGMRVHTGGVYEYRCQRCGTSSTGSGVEKTCPCPVQFDVAAGVR